MSEFFGLDEGRRLLAILATGIREDRVKPQLTERDDNPLYRFEQSDNLNRYDIDPAIAETFRLLKLNGYGVTFVAKDDELFRNKARSNLAGCDPSWIGGLDRHDVDKLLYFMNQQQCKGVTSIHYLPERICDGTFHAILSHAMELGANLKHAPSMPAVHSAPVQRLG